MREDGGGREGVSEGEVYLVRGVNKGEAKGSLRKSLNLNEAVLYSTNSQFVLLLVNAEKKELMTLPE